MVRKTHQLTARKSFTVIFQCEEVSEEYCRAVNDVEKFF